MSSDSETRGDAAEDDGFDATAEQLAEAIGLALSSIQRARLERFERFARLFGSLADELREFTCGDPRADDRMKRFIRNNPECEGAGSVAFLLQYFDASAAAEFISASSLQATQATEALSLRTLAAVSTPEVWNFDEALALLLATKFQQSLLAQVARVRALSRLARKGEIPERIAVYLPLVSECYIEGLDAACVVMCRSALEQAVRDAFERRGREAGDLAMNARLLLMEKEGWLTEPARRAAQSIWFRGNKAAHEGPVVSDVLLHVRQLAAVLEQIVER